MGKVYITTLLSSRNIHHPKQNEKTKRGGKMEEIENITLEDTKIGIGTEEMETLKPTKVKVIITEVLELGTKKSKKLVCSCKYPGRQEAVKISSVKYELKGKLQSVGLWVNKDSKGLIRKGSALAVFLTMNNCKTIDEVIGKDIDTTTDEKGYLCFKAY